MAASRRTKSNVWVPKPIVLIYRKVAQKVSLAEIAHWPVQGGVLQRKLDTDLGYVGKYLGQYIRAKFLSKIEKYNK